MHIISYNMDYIDETFHEYYNRTIALVSNTIACSNPNLSSHLEAKSRPLPEGNPKKRQKVPPCPLQLRRQGKRYAGWGVDCLCSSTFFACFFFFVVFFFHFFFIPPPPPPSAKRNALGCSENDTAPSKRWKDLPHQVQPQAQHQHPTLEAWCAGFEIISEFQTQIGIFVVVYSTCTYKY